MTLKGKTSMIMQLSGIYLKESIKWFKWYSETVSKSCLTFFSLKSVLIWSKNLEIAVLRHGGLVKFITGSH